MKETSHISLLRAFNGTVRELLISLRENCWSSAPGWQSREGVDWQYEIFAGLAIFCNNIIGYCCKDLQQTCRTCNFKSFAVLRLAMASKFSRTLCLLYYNGMFVTVVQQASCVIEPYSNQLCRRESQNIFLSIFKILFSFFQPHIFPWVSGFRSLTVHARCRLWSRISIIWYGWFRLRDIQWVLVSPGAPFTDMD